uniref:Bicarbonate transporter-like transmembrane domain-containing protein n=1 Tax=Physcomitrium patens TaxID=3218 RepID=A0A7I4BXC6_PHYPA
MGKIVPFNGVREDLRGRLACYKDDWTGGFNSTYRILAATAYIFFASALPVIAFGEQLGRDTEGVITAVQTLSSTTICGIIQAIVGGQPLLIVGVSEPTSLVYTFMYDFAKNRPEIGARFFLGWAAWVCVWSAFMLAALAILGACNFINRFTRVAGELFGLLIAVLFVQQAVKGAVNEFRISKFVNATEEQFQSSWRFGNGMFGLILTFGLLWTAIKSRNARSWNFGPGFFRRFIANYGVPILVIVWSAVSYARVGSVPAGIPRRLTSPNPWKSPIATTHWDVVADMNDIPGVYIAAAIVPALMIVILYYFDHCVSAQLAQQPEFNLRKPFSYHYDLLLLGFTVLLCGLLGLPPSHGVLPQSPMHTRALASLKKEATKELHINITSSDPGSPMNKVNFDPEKDVDPLLPVEVKEQRLSNLLQSLLVAACIGAMPALKKIPSSVLWGYFAYMAIESLPGNQFWGRICLLFSSSAKRYKALETTHPMFMHTVPFKVTATFTIFQLVYMICCYGITWIPIGGVLFPVLIMLLIPVRQFVLPRFFKREYLQQLDSAEYEEVAPLPQSLALKEAEAQGLSVGSDTSDDASLDHFATAARGEIKHPLPLPLHNHFGHSTNTHEDQL